MRLIGFTIVVALAFASCSKPVADEDSDSPSAPPPAEKSTAAATPAPPKVGSAQAPASAAPSSASDAKSVANKAPEGVFYLISPARVETSAGVQNLPVGTGVRLVRPGVYQTPVGEASLPADKLTNDMAAARAARDAAVAAVAAEARPQRATPPTVLQAPATPKATPTLDANHMAAVKNMQLQQNDRDIAALKRQYEALQTQENALALKKSKEDFNRYAKGRNVASSTDQQLAQIQAQMTAVQDKLNQALYLRERLR